MKQLTLSCRSCRRIKIFKGQDIEEIMRKIDESGWIDRPSDDGNSCPECVNKEA